MRDGRKLALAGALGLGFVFLALGCDEGSASTESAAVTAAQEDAEAPPLPPPGPRPCRADADCTGACPTGSAGCACLAGCGDRMMCLATCAADTDCPTADGLPPLVCREGACRPERPPRPPLPPPCASDADCADGCPAGEQGCTCRALPNDGPSVCMIRCAAASECRLPPGAPADAPPPLCQDGVCVPPLPPPGPPPCGPPPGPDGQSPSPPPAP